MEKKKTENFEAQVKATFEASDKDVQVLFANEHGHCFTNEFEGCFKVNRKDFEKVKSKPEPTNNDVDASGDAKTKRGKKGNSSETSETETEETTEA